MEGDEGGVVDNATTVEKEVSRPVVLLAAGAQTFSSASPISVVYAFWKDFDLETWRVQLDDQGLQIGKNQESSLKNRRKLAESTRDFKKASQEEKTKSFPALLKGYQEEVDNLTKRAKFGENAFLNIYQKLYEAPDPAPALSSATELAGKIAEVELENRKMKQELEEYHTETAYLKNQQATVRRLEERNRLLEQQMEEKVKEIVEMKQRSLAEENQKNLEALNEREKLLQDQLRAATQSVQNMQRLHEYGQSQLFELQAQSEEISAAKQSELNLLTDEVDRAQSRLLSLEREKEQLQLQLEAVHNQEAQFQER
jgi:homeobox protein cut-like